MANLIVRALERAGRHRVYTITTVGIFKFTIMGTILWQVAIGTKRILFAISLSPFMEFKVS